MARFRLRYKASNLELRPGEFAIGRSSACNLAVADGLVSRRHAVLHVRPDAVVLEDLGSRNGVAVNGARINSRRPLKHMDRVYIGSQELVLIDAAKITERHDSDQHLVCDSCGAINGRAKRYCGDCGERLKSGAGATIKERMSGSVDPPDHNWGDSSSTHTARALDVLGDIAAKAITMGRFDEAERMLSSHLDTLLERALRGSPLSDSEKDDAEAMFVAGTNYALKLAEGLDDTKWIDWIFRIHTALGRLMTAETIETLHRLVRSHDYKQSRYLRAYLHVIRSEAAEYSASERFLVGRLDGLAQVVMAS